MNDKNKIKECYLSGMSYRKIADKFHISHTTVARMVKAENWKKLKEQVKKRTDELTVQKVAAAETDGRLKMYAAVEMLIDKATAMIDHCDSPKELKELTGCFKDIKDIRGYKSDNEIREQLARIRNLEKQLEDGAKDEAVRVLFGEDPEGNEYAE